MGLPYAEIGVIPFYPVSGKEIEGTEGGTLAHYPRVLPLYRLLALLDKIVLFTEKLSDSSFDSLSDVQAARETCCETKRETVKEERFTPPVRMYMAMKRNVESHR